MKQLLVLLVALAGLAVPASAPAQDPAAVVQARRSGLVGERYDGYLGVVSPAVSAELRRQVASINIRRRALYSNLASKRGVSPQEVGITTACSLLRRISVGEYYMPGQGGWRRYTPGTSPVPRYCV